MKNSKTDAVDAETLAQYAERMDFVACMIEFNEMLLRRLSKILRFTGEAVPP
jgi:hypothetical protein